MSEFVTKIRTDKGDLQIDYNALANLPALNTMFSNPNLLINSDFRYPVNQRGLTEYAIAPEWTYSIDRWKFIGALSVKIDNDSLLLTNSENTSWFMQKFEHELPTESYTITAKVRDVTGLCSMYFENSNGKQTKIAINKTGLVTLSFTSSINAVTFELQGASVLQLEWVKLEVGSSSTAFTPRLWAEELALCRRYFDVICGVRAIGIEHNTSAHTISYSIPRNMLMAGPATVTVRGNTTINSTDGICVRDNGCTILTMSNFEYEARDWEVMVTAHASSDINRESYATQLYINDAFLICLDAEIY